jgi:hypothetical protein
MPKSKHYLETHALKYVWFLIDAEAGILHVPLDPVRVTWDTCVDTGVPRAPAAHSPRHDACNKEQMKSWRYKLYSVLKYHLIKGYGVEVELHIFLISALKLSTRTKAGDTEVCTNGVRFTLEVTEYFIHQLSEADWLTRARDSRCVEESTTQLPSFVSVTLDGSEW